MQHTIKLYPTKICITNYDLGDSLKLEKSLSVWDPVIFQVVYQAFEYDEDNRILTIPGGYNLFYLEEILTKPYTFDDSHKDIVEDYRKTMFSLKYPTRNTLQNQAINFLMRKINQKFLSLETGGGKTYCTIHYVFKSKKMPITFVDQENIASQWLDRILYFTSIKEDEIYTISGQKSIDKIMNMSDEEIGKYKWFIAIHRTMSNYLASEGHDKVKALFKKMGIGVRLYDEAHVEYRNIFNMDSSYDCESVYITATPTRSNPLENKVYQNMFSLKSVPRFVGKGDNYHNVLVYKYTTKPDLDEEMSMKSKYGFDAIKWTNYIMNDNFEIFSESLTEILDLVYRKNSHKTAVLIKSIELCDKVYDEFKDYLGEKGLTCGRYHSKVKNKDAELEKDVIFTTEKSFGKALDIPGLSVCVNTVPCSSEATVLQIIGRLREIPDKEVFFVDMYDYGFDMQCKQAAKRLKIYKNKAKKIYNATKK